LTPRAPLHTVRDMKLIATPVLAVLAVLGVLVVAACGDDAATDPCGEPAYGGVATDEAWRVMLDAYDAAESGAADAVTITSPAAAAVIAASGPAPTLSWTSPIAAASPEDRSLVPRFAVRARGDADDPSNAGRSLWDEVTRFFVGTARAHLPPITSDIYYVEIATAGVECPWRVLTTSESWVPDDQTWAELAAHPGAYTLTVTSAYLVQNRITEGPYRPAAATAFEIR